MKNGALDVTAAPSAALPEEMVEMDAEERQAYVGELDTERERIRSEIEDMDKKRKRHIAKEAKDAGKGGLDEAMGEALDDQL